MPNEPLLDIPIAIRFDVDTYVPDYDIQEEYRNYIQRHGIRSFLNKYIPDNITKIEVCELILDLGYSRDNVRHHETHTTKELAGILVNLLLEDIKLRLPATKDGKRIYSISQFINDLRLSSNVLIITGAGISTSLGIPDFRSIQGLYNQLSHLHLNDPQLVFDINEFTKRPETFYSVAHLILPPEDKFSLLHAFIRMLQDKKQLLRNYTQNIDNLEYYAGIDPSKLIQCHGSFGTASCLTCRSRFAGPKIFNHIKQKQIPRCSSCWKNTQEAAISYGVIKPDITFFGEDLPKKFYKSIVNDSKKCDLVLVVGTSLKVEPVASIIDNIPRRIPRVLINKDPLPDRDFDLTLLGYSDAIASLICSKMGPEWSIPHHQFEQDLTSDFVPHERLPKTFIIED
ncbi:DHS-like NAD/FAD-binding domain-containing protein [Scheffersomyces coipomensis]|uniref:DHS-like NAD/FAD-binding domain-containing protein n=1 Tax=Scheffersomyces coipomensis TaxID=1788519 RepID=UPI00315CB413